MQSVSEVEIVLPSRRVMLGGTRDIPGMYVREIPGSRYTLATIENAEVELLPLEQCLPLLHGCLHSEQVDELRSAGNLIASRYRLECGIVLISVIVAEHIKYNLLTTELSK